MPQNVLIQDFEWVKDTKPFNKDFIKDCNEDIAYYFELDYFLFYQKNNDRKERKTCVQFEWQERIRCTLKYFKTSI